MPPDGPLNKDQISLIVDWINQGAKVDLSVSKAPPPSPGAGARNPPPEISTVTTAAQERAMLGSLETTRYPPWDRVMLLLSMKAGPVRTGAVLPPLKLPLVL